VVTPAATPVTTPEALTVAIATSAMLHEPAGVASSSEIVKPWQTDENPLMGSMGAAAVTLTMVIAEAGPQPPGLPVFIINTCFIIFKIPRCEFYSFYWLGLVVRTIR